MYKPFHFYQVFNPMLNEGSIYQTQAHEFYYSLKHSYAQNQGDKNFLYWGKIDVAESKDHAEKLNSLVRLNKENGFDTFLYLTDYHHFWVAKVESVQTEIHNPQMTLPFYDNKEVSIWFKISDMDLLSAEFQESNHYISLLHVNNEFSDKNIESLNPYIGGLRFPLVVQDRSEENYFNSPQLRITEKNMLIEQPGLCQVEREKMTTFVIPPHIFKQLKHNDKKLILESELHLKSIKTSQEVRTQIFKGYSSVLENVLDQVMGTIIKERYGDSLWISEDGLDFYEEQSQENLKALNYFNGTIKLQGYLNLLSSLKTFGNLSLSKVEEDFPEMVNFCMTTLIPFLGEREIPAKFMSEQQQFQVQSEEVIALRNFVLGVGCEGVINTLFTQAINWQGVKRLPAA